MLRDGKTNDFLQRSLENYVPRHPKGLVVHLGFKGPTAASNRKICIPD